MPDIENTDSARADAMAESEARKVFYDFIADVLEKAVPVPGSDYAARVLDSLRWIIDEDGEGEAALALRAASDQLLQDPERVQLEMARSRTALVLGTDPASAVKPPFESLYLTETDAPADIAAVSGTYRAFGFELLPGSGNRPDSLEIECRFMAALCDEESRAADAFDAAALGHVRDVQKRFMAEHLALWVPTYCEAAAAQSASSLLKGVFLFIRDFIRDEEATLCA